MSAQHSEDSNKLFHVLTTQTEFSVLSVLLMDI